jgi:hypothetical protein
MADMDDQLELSNPFNNSRLLDIHRWSKHPHVVTAVDGLAAELGMKDKRLIKCLRMLIMDLYHAWRVDPTQYLTYSRGENEYRGGTRYNKLRIKYDAMKKTVDALRGEGYVDHHMGGYFFNEQSGTYYGFASRMRAAKKLIRYIVTQRVKATMISKHEDQELIVKRSVPVEVKKGKKTIKVKNDIEYDDEPVVITRMRSRLVAYNELLNRAYIDVDDDHLTDEEQKELRQYRLDLSRKKVHRVFNNDSWTQGGRFYGAWWMDCPKILRKYIVIDGCSSVELDYSGMHIHLLYAIEGINYAAAGEDAYTIDGYPNRGLNKYILLIAINAESEDDCVKGVWKRLVDKKKLSEYGISKPDQILNVLLAIKTKHSRIAQYITSGYGVKLQYIDSCIADKVTTYFTKLNIPILTVHDSFICTQLDEMVLLDIMKTAYISELSKLVDINYISEVDEIWYDTGLVKVELDNDAVIDVDRKAISPERWTAIRNDVRQYDQRRRELKWINAGNASLLCKLTNILYSIPD